MPKFDKNRLNFERIFDLFRGLGKLCKLRGLDNAYNQDKVGGSYNVTNMI